MRAKYVLDTNHLSPAIYPVSQIRERLHEAHRQGMVLGTCIPVLCELEAGLEFTVHATSYRQQLAWLLHRVRLWPIDQGTARRFGTLFRELRTRGRVLSQVDMILAALAKQMNLTLLTTDKDFEALSNLRIENWLS